MKIRFAPVVVARLALLGVVLLLAARLVLFVTHSVEVLSFPWQIDFDEGVILNSSWLLAQGHTPYPANSPGYFVSSVYQPLFYALNALALDIWGLNLWSGRALSLLGTLLAAGAIVLWTAAETRARLAGWVAACVWLALGPVIVWASFYKMDILALGCGAMGGALLARACPPDGAALDRRTFWGLPWLAWGAIVLQLLAFWTKQSALAVFVVSGIYLLWRDWRSGLRWCLVSAVALVGPFLLLDALTHGQLYVHLSMASDFALSPNKLRKQMLALWDYQWPLLIIGGAVILGLVGQALRRLRPLPLSLLYALCSLPILILTNLSPYANYNHLLDGLLPLCLLLGVGLGNLERLARTRALALLPLTAAVALLVAQAALFSEPLSQWFGPFTMPLSEQAQHMANIEAAIKESPGDIILTEDIWMALKAGKTVPFDDTVQLAARAQQSDSVMLDYIKQHQFPLIVLEYDLTRVESSERLSAQALATLKQEYVLKFPDVRYVYAPVAPPAAPTAPQSCTLDGGPTLAGLYLPGGGVYLAPGGVQPLSIYWTTPVAATIAPQPGLKFSVQLLDPGGATIWQADVPPGATSGQNWPAWQPGSLVRDDLQIAAPLTAPVGKYSLRLSAYVQQGEQIIAVPFSCVNAAPNPSVMLATPRVVSGAHN